MRAAEAFPDDWAGALHAGGPAIVPWGAIEWHGPHLPLGLDGALAEDFACRLAARTGGVVLPTQWNPVTTLPHPASLDVPTPVFRALADAVLAGLAGAGFRTVAVVSGHYAQGHLIELYGAAERAMDAVRGLRVFAATPLEPLGDPDRLDHAGRWETAQFLNVRPDLVRLDRLPPGPPDPAVCAVLGEDPRRADADDGATACDAALDAWTRWLAEADTDALRAGYARSAAALADYADRYGGEGWEAGIRRWWAERTGTGRAGGESA